MADEGTNYLRFLDLFAAEDERLAPSPRRG
jgi:hypothetical protein